MATNASRRITIEIEAITKGAGAVRSLGNEYAAMVSKAQANLNKLKQTGASLDGAADKSVREFAKLGKQIEATSKRADELKKKLANSGATINKSQFVAITSEIAKANDKVNQLRAKQDAVTKSAAATNKAYAQTQRAIAAAAASVQRLQTAGRAIQAISSVAASVGRNVQRAFESAARGGARAFESVRRSLETIGRQKLAPDFKVNLEPLTGGLTRAIALGGVLAATLIGIGRTGINFAVSNLRDGVEAVGTLERFDLLVGTIAEQEVEALNTVTKRIPIGRVLAQQNQKAIKDSVTALDIDRARYDIENARLNLEADRLDQAEFKPDKGDSSARTDIEFRRASLNVRGSELALAQQEADYAELTAKANEQKARSAPRYVTQYKTITELTGTEADRLRQSLSLKQQLLDWNRKLTLSSPFTREQVSNAFVTANAYGFASKNAQKLTEQLVDYAAGTGKSSESVERLATAFGQMKAAGKLTGQEILQFVNNGLPILNILAKQMGISTGEVKKLGEQGKLTFEKVLPIIEEYFDKFKGKGAEVARKTISGIISSFSDLKEFSLAQVFAPSVDALKPELLSLLDLFSGQEGTRFFQDIGNGLGGITKDAIPKFKTLAKGVRGFFSGLKTGRDILDGVRGAFLNLFPDTSAQGVETFDKIVAAIRNTRDTLVNSNLGKLIASIPEKLAGLPAKVIAEFDRLKSAFNTGGIKGVAEALGIDAGTATTIENVAKSIGKIGAGVLELDPEKIKSGLGEIGKTLYDAISNSDIKQRIIDGLKAAVTSAGEGIKAAFSEGGIGTRAIEGLGAALSNLGERAKQAFIDNDIGGKIAAGARAAVGTVGSSIRNIVLDAVNPSGGQGGGNLESQLGAVLKNVALFLGESALRLASELLAALSGFTVRAIGELSKIGVDLETKAKTALGGAISSVAGFLADRQEEINKALGIQVYDTTAIRGIEKGIVPFLEAQAEGRKKVIDQQVSAEIKAIKDRAIDRDRQILEAFGAGSAAQPIGLPPQVQSAIGATAGKASSEAFNAAISPAEQKAVDFQKAIELQSTAIKDTVTLTKDAVGTQFDTMALDITSKTQTGFTDVNTIIAARGVDINKTVGEITKSVKQTWVIADWRILGVEFVNGIIKGIDEGETRLFQRIRDLIAGAITVAKEEGAIKSPSRKTNVEVGQPLGQGIVRGLIQTQEQINAAMRTLVAGAINAGQVVTGSPVGAPIPATTVPNPWAFAEDAFKNNIIGPKPSGGVNINFNGVNVRSESDLDQLAWKVATAIRRRSR